MTIYRLHPILIVKLSNFTRAQNKECSTDVENDEWYDDNVDKSQILGLAGVYFIPF